MPTPRRESTPGATPASAYVLECQLKRAYAALLAREVTSIWHPATRKAKAVQVLGGDLAATQVRHAESRLCEAIPEVLQRLKVDQQPAVAALLLGPDPDLTAVVALLVKLERNLNYRDDDPALKREDDDWKVKALGFGRFRPKLAGTALLQRQRKQAREAPKLGPPLELTSWVPTPAVGGVRTKRRRKPRAVPVCRGQLPLWPLLAGGVEEAGL